MAVSTLAGLAILIIGESHMSFPNYLINPLYDDLTSKGAVVHAVGACGASAGDWLKTVNVPCGADRRAKTEASFKGRDATTTPIRQLIQEDKPDLVVVIIGDTMASYDKEVFPRAWAWQSTTSLTKEIASTKTPCVWIGPPHGTEGGKYFKNDKRAELISQFFTANVAPCVYVDSLKFSNPGQWATLDGQHFNMAGYKSWSIAITNTLAELPITKGLKKP